MPYDSIILAPIRVNASYPPPLKTTPCPMPEGFHLHQRQGIRHSASQPMTPGEQFNRISVYQKWEKSVVGVPNDVDIEVSIYICDLIHERSFLPCTEVPILCASRNISPRHATDAKHSTEQCQLPHSCKAAKKSRLERTESEAMDRSPK